ncbi:MAG: ISL3 family transposase [Elusimicrobia bacterium]|nr:ISL3 family transposase [Elusimicrobiota bacterium]
MKRLEPGFHKGQSSVVVHMERIIKGHTCGKCGQAVEQGYDSSWQEVQHLMLWHHLCFLRFERYRVNCPRCGIRTEALEFVDVRGPRVSLRLARLVAELCKVMTNKSVGLFQVMHRGTIKEIDKRAMTKVQAERPLDGITVMGADEIAVGRGQNYWTMISVPEGPRGPELLNVVEGRREKSLRKFWKWFGKDRARRVTHVVMDMWAPFRNSFKAHCPDIQIIYDKFHVIRHLLNAVNDVRKSEFKKRAGKRFRGLLAGKKFILLSRLAHVRGKSREALNDLLAASPKLLKAHLLKESFGHLWSYKSRTCARRFFRQWVDQLKWTRMKSMRQFAKRVEKHLDGILAFCDKKVSLGYVEATNLKAKNIIRRAYGFRDKAYMKLKIIQGCTPWMSQFRPWTVTHSSSS